MAMRVSRSRTRPVALAPDAAYAKWAETYLAQPHNALMRGEQEVVFSILSAIPFDRALDVGAGTGRVLARLDASNGRLVAGLDRSAEMLRHVERGLGRLVRGDAGALPFQRESWDLVVSSLMAGDIGALPPWTAEVQRVLKPGGHFVYSDFHPSWHERGWTRTFTDRAGTTFVLPCRAHTLEDHRHGCSAAGLTTISIHEFTLPRDGQSSTETMRARWADPLIGVVVHARKPESPSPTDTSANGPTRRPEEC